MANNETSTGSTDWRGRLENQAMLLSMVARVELFDNRQLASTVAAELRVPAESLEVVGMALAALLDTSALVGVEAIPGSRDDEFKQLKRETYMSEFAKRFANSYGYEEPKNV